MFPGEYLFKAGAYMACWIRPGALDQVSPLSVRFRHRQPVAKPARPAGPAQDGDSCMIVVIDNYDSFTYNLVQRIGELGLGRGIRVFRNDAAEPQQVEQDLSPRHLIISPGPCTPNEAGRSCEFVRYFHGKLPVLGVCLGHQCIGQVFGGKVVRAERLMHGKTSDIRHDGKGVLAGLPNPFTATRYHSLVVDPKGLDPDFEETAWSDDRGELMGIRSRTCPTEGVQFHPESFLTDTGHRMLRNFLEL
jgi:anthranilate synthase/aminodeoxychorismate synthase-like glutamine amidotransferase